MENIKISELDNGVRIVTENIDGFETASIGIWVKTGSRNEPKEINGISHFIEHMFFQGTKNRSVKQIASEIEDKGGYLNAYTSREITAYYAKVLKEEVASAFDVVSDIVLNSTFPINELNKERGVVIQEIKQNNDDPEDVAYDMFQSAMYKNQPLGRTILGTEEIISKLQPSDLFSYVKKFYTPSNMVISAAGAVNHEQIVELASKVFTSKEKSEKNKPFLAKYENGYDYRFKDLEQINLFLGFEGVSYYHEDYYKAALLGNILGGGTTSRLFQEIREKRGLVYSVYSHSLSYTDTGTFYIAAGTSEKELPELIDVACDEINKICHDVSEDELLAAKIKNKSSILMALEQSSHRLEKNAKNLLFFDRIIPVSEIIEKIEKVSLVDIKETAFKLFKSKPSISALGKINALEDYDKIAAKIHP